MRINIVATPEGEECQLKPDDLVDLVCDMLKLQEHELQGNRIVMSHDEGRIKRLTFELV